MLTMNVTKNFDLSKMNFKLTDELNRGIDMVAVDIEDGINKGSQFGKPFQRNAELTIKKKGYDWPLKQSGLMKDSGVFLKY